MLQEVDAERCKHARCDGKQQNDPAEVLEQNRLLASPPEQRREPLQQEESTQKEGKEPAGRVKVQCQAKTGAADGKPGMRAPVDRTPERREGQCAQERCEDPSDAETGEVHVPVGRGQVE